MNLRLATVGTIAMLFAYGCAQSGSPLPASSAQSRPVRTFGEALPRQSPALQLFNTPTSFSWPDYIVRGPQHALWFSEFYSDKIGRVAMNGKMTEFSLPDNTDIEGITAGADGNIWFTAPGAAQIGRMTPQGTVTTFPIEASNPSPRGMTLGPDGNVWYVEFYDGYIGRVTPQGVITRFAIPEGPYSSPWTITTGPDGDLWFSESFSNKLGRFNPATQQFDAPLTVPTQNATPWGVIMAPDKHIWFTERNGDKIAEVTATGKIKEFAIAQAGSYPEALAPGGDGKLWFTEMQAGNVGNIDPKTGKFGQLVTLPGNAIPIGITEGFNKNVWFCISFYHNPMQIGEVLLH
ncbi:MAG TPA: Virginiamycin B lyase [Candidatus Nitrosotalea sp.]|nr:Virginiamycin B lyase [Candidatus Nitrosotalea sp.]